MNLKNESKEILIFASIALLTALAFSFWLFSLTGLKVALAIIIGFLPFYIFLNALSLEEGEKIVFSLLLGITLFPSIAFLLGFLMPFRLSMAVAFAALAAAAFAAAKFRK
ncbi:hypothetical protein HY637_01120 [Candidatus Woesearchaeota archaeon]|nr:hypothetical protein [Candidatus Woesearchaeota archaeon]